MNPLPPPTNNNRPRIESLYTLKAIASFFVVMVHSSFYQREWFMFIIGVGTPCFLCITGYLLYSDDLERERQKCFKWAIKSVKLALFCFIFYWIFKTLVYNQQYSISTLLLNLITGAHVAPTLWYLTALWEALLLFALIRQHKPKLIYYLPLLLIIAYLLRTHPEIVPNYIDPQKIDYLRSNAIITSLPFLCCGYLIHKHKDALLSCINVDLWLPIMLFVLLGEYATRVFTGLPFNLFSICSFPCIFLLMLFCIRHADFKVPVLNDIGKKHSANIYYFHAAVIGTLNTLCLTEYIPKVEALVVWLLCIPVSILFNAGVRFIGRIAPHLQSK